jgi:hypothetical protein
MKAPILGGSLALLAGLLATASASAATLKVGDPAPKLQVGKWVQGEPVKELASLQRGELPKAE